MSPHELWLSGPPEPRDREEDPDYHDEQNRLTQERREDRDDT
jgi:hypothetical protein